MKVEISQGEKIEVSFKDSDERITVSFLDDRLMVEADLPDSSGREGVIYEELWAPLTDFSKDDGDRMEHGDDF